MSMQSEIATEFVVKQIVHRLENEINATKNEEVRTVLKRQGRFALNLLEWETPKWAERFDKLFSE